MAPTKGWTNGEDQFHPHIYMRSFCKGDQLDWPKLLPVEEFYHNTTKMVSYGETSFFVCHVIEMTQAEKFASDRVNGIKTRKYSLSTS